MYRVASGRCIRALLASSVLTLPSSWAKDTDVAALVTSHESGRDNPARGIGREGARPVLAFAPLRSRASEADFGVDAGSLDLPSLTDDAFADLAAAVLTHQVVVVRGQ